MTSRCRWEYAFRDEGSALGLAGLGMKDTEQAAEELESIEFGLLLWVTR
jgi:hypothetical protein